MNKELALSLIEGTDKKLIPGQKYKIESPDYNGEPVFMYGPKTIRDGEVVYVFKDERSDEHFIYAHKEDIVELREIEELGTGLCPSPGKQSNDPKKVQAVSVSTMS